MKRLSDAELEIMLAVWDAGEPVTSGYVHRRLFPTRNWQLPAVVTAMNRLVEKGFLACDRQGRNNLYRPLVEKQAYMAQESRGILDRLFGGSFKGLVAALYDGEAIGDQDLDDLRKYLDELEGK